MPYKCKSCNKTSRRKTFRTLLTMFSTRRCPGCGSKDLSYIDYSMGATYDFEEAGFTRPKDQMSVESNIQLSSTKLSQCTPRYRDIAPSIIDDTEIASPLMFNLGSSLAYGISCGLEEPSQHNHNMEPSPSSYDSGSSYDSSSYDSSSCDCSCDCGGGD